MIQTIVGLLILATAIVTSIIWWKKRQARVCTCPKNPQTSELCGRPTKRIKKMVVISSLGRYTRFCKWLVIDDCGPHAQRITGGDKRFVWHKMLYRRLFHPSEFVPDEELLKKAGLLDETVPSLAERMRMVEEKNNVRNKRLVEQVNCRSLPLPQTLPPKSRPIVLPHFEEVGFKRK